MAINVVRHFFSFFLEYDDIVCHKSTSHTWLKWKSFLFLFLQKKVEDMKIKKDGYQEDKKLLPDL